MNEITLFNYEENEVRVVRTGSEPYWVALDVCKALGIKNMSKALTRIDADEKDELTLSDVTGRNQKMIVVNEPGLYSLIFCSRKEKAIRFKRWITHEVLPSIRKNGAYVAPTTTVVVPNNDPLVHQIEMLLAVAKRQSQIEAQVVENQTNANEAKQIAQEALEIASGDTGFCTVLGYARRLGTRLTLSQAQRMGKALSKYCRENKLPIGQVPDGRHGFVFQYLNEVLEKHKSLFLSPV